MSIKLDMSISDGLIRLSIGIEDQSNLKNDFAGNVTCIKLCKFLLEIPL